MTVTYADVDVFLEHHGVKGMHWGVRHDRSSSDSLVDISKTGAITMQKGATLQRVVRRSNGPIFKAASDFGSSVTYASFSKKDNAVYETMFGRKKSLFNKNPSEVLSLTAKKTLKSPAPQEAVDIFFKTLKSDPKLLEEAQSKAVGFAKSNLKKGLADPKSYPAHAYYTWSFDSGVYGKETSAVNDSFIKNVKKAGYNMLLDPSDSSAGISDTPVILLDSKNTVEITGRRIVDKVSAKAASKALAEEEKISDGKTFLEKLGYA